MDIRLLSVFLLGFLLLDGYAVVFASDTTEPPVEADRDSSGPSTDDRRAEPVEDGATDTVKNAKVHGTADDDADASAKELEIYQSVRRLYKQKRSQQQNAVQDILGKYNYQQQHKLVELVFDRMMEVLVESKEQLVKSSFKPEMPFPVESGVREAVSLLFENLGFFADITLRLPDITHSLYSKKKQLRDIVRWSVTFTKGTGFLDKSQWKLMHLMSQELHLIKRDPDFINPFKKVVPLEPAEPKKKKAKKPKKKGPRLSRPEL